MASLKETRKRFKDGSHPEPVAELHRSEPDSRSEQRECKNCRYRGEIAYAKGTGVGFCTRKGIHEAEGPMMVCEDWEQTDGQSVTVDLPPNLLAPGVDSAESAARDVGEAIGAESDPRFIEMLKVIEEEGAITLADADAILRESFPHTAIKSESLERAAEALDVPFSELMRGHVEPLEADIPNCSTCSHSHVTEDAFLGSCDKPYLGKSRGAMCPNHSPKVKPSPPRCYDPSSGCIGCDPRACEYAISTTEKISMPRDSMARYPASGFGPAPEYTGVSPRVLTCSACKGKYFRGDEHLCGSTTLCPDCGADVYPKSHTKSDCEAEIRARKDKLITKREQDSFWDA